MTQLKQNQAIANDNLWNLITKHPSCNKTNDPNYREYYRLKVINHEADNKVIGQLLRDRGYAEDEIKARLANWDWEINDLPEIVN